MSHIDDFEAQFFSAQRADSLAMLSELVASASKSPAERRAAMTEIVRRVDHPHVGFAAYLALAGGALIEAGEPAAALGKAIVPPLRRALTNAARMLAHVADLPDAAQDEEDDHDDADDDHDHDGHAHDEEPDPDGVSIGTKWVSRDRLDAIADRDVAAVQAWFALDTWYRPAVAAWTREPAVLREVQRDEALRAALDALGDSTETSHWLSLLIETVFDARFVALFPEISQAWTFTADGVVDMGQLWALMSEPLAEPLAAIGVSAVADSDMLAVMRGDGPQQREGGYACAFHCYPAETVDASGMPRDDVYTWIAPGGAGTHSLPPDFLPGTLQPVEGARLLIIVGPRSPGMRFIRQLSAVRTFDALAARVSPAARLAPDQTKQWVELARARAGSISKRQAD